MKPVGFPPGKHASHSLDPLIRASNSRSLEVSTLVKSMSTREENNFCFAAAGELPKPPEKPVVFLEGQSHTQPLGKRKSRNSVFCIDLGDAALASAVCTLGRTSPMYLIDRAPAPTPGGVSEVRIHDLQTAILFLPTDGWPM